MHRAGLLIEVIGVACDLLPAVLEYSIFIGKIGIAVCGE